MTCRTSGLCACLCVYVSTEKFNIMYLAVGVETGTFGTWAFTLVA